MEQNDPDFVELSQAELRSLPLQKQLKYQNALNKWKGERKREDAVEASKNFSFTKLLNKDIDKRS